MRFGDEVEGEVEGQVEDEVQGGAEDKSNDEIGDDVRDDIDDLFLSLLSLIVCLDHVQDVVILCLNGGKRNLTNVELLSLIQTCMTQTCC